MISSSTGKAERSIGERKCRRMRREDNMKNNGVGG